MDRRKEMQQKGPPKRASRAFLALLGLRSSLMVNAVWVLHLRGRTGKVQNLSEWMHRRYHIMASPFIAVLFATITIIIIIIPLDENPSASEWAWAKTIAAVNENGMSRKRKDLGRPRGKQTYRGMKVRKWRIEMEREKTTLIEKREFYTLREWERERGRDREDTTHWLGERGESKSHQRTSVIGCEMYYGTVR